MNSMTGFAQIEGDNDFCSWVWEARSVNSKGIDIRPKLPTGFEALDLDIRERKKKSFQRGNISTSLKVNWLKTNINYYLNFEIFEQLMEMVSEVEKRAPEILPLTMDGLLSLKGLVESREGSLNNAKQETVHSEILMSFDNLLKRLQTVRHQEGEKLKALIKSQIKKVELLCRDTNQLIVLQSQRIKKKPKEQISELRKSFPNLSEDRLAQEVLVLILKSDVREELDRIIVHTEAAMGLLTSDEAVGRQFKFLCQEFNQEANTLRSTSNDVEITKVGLSLKTVIDQMREQGQNVE